MNQIFTKMNPDDPENNIVIIELENDIVDLGGASYEDALLV